MSDTSPEYVQNMLQLLHEAQDAMADPACMEDAIMSHSNTVDSAQVLIRDLYSQVEALRDLVRRVIENDSDKFVMGFDWHDKARDAIERGDL